MDGWITRDGLWCEGLPPLPPTSPKLDPGIYDRHARRAAEIHAGGQAKSLAAACRMATDELGRGQYWGANDPRLGVPDRFYRRAKALLKGD
jgi:hypothetical protein